jgi:alkylation response protein AidB-like acyl-CoA dehydrogenase
MNFDYSEEQILLKDQARKFLGERCTSTHVRAVLDHADKTYDADLWKGMAELGWLGVAIPETYGGLGLGRVELCAIAEELGRACAPVPMASSIYGAAEALMIAGSPQQKERLLPTMASGETIGSLAFVEGPGPLTARSIKASVASGKLTGRKRPVTDGDIATFTIVLAKESDKLSLYVVPLDAGSAKRTTLSTVDPTRNASDIEFLGAPAERLGNAGDGLVLVQAIYDRMAAYLAFEQIGGADKCLEMGRDYALSRYAFGRTIASYQAIKHKLVGMYAKNQIARSNAYYVAWALNTTAPELPLAAATARVAASEAYWHASKENIQTHGGMGFTWAADCHLYYRRARQLGLVIGAPRVWRERLVQQLLAQAAA